MIASVVISDRLHNNSYLLHWHLMFLLCFCKFIFYFDMIMCFSSCVIKPEVVRWEIVFLSFLFFHPDSSHKNKRIAGIYFSGLLQYKCFLNICVKSIFNLLFINNSFWIWYVFKVKAFWRLKKNNKKSLVGIFF